MVDEVGWSLEFLREKMVGRWVVKAEERGGICFIFFLWLPINRKKIGFVWLFSALFFFPFFSPAFIRATSIE